MSTQPDRDGEKEITGWMAWHPEYGARSYTFGERINHAWSACGDTCMGADDRNKPNWRKTLQEKYGWRIRPCKITFTDEEPK